MILPAPASLLCFSTAFKSFAKASAKSRTPSARSRSVTSSHGDTDLREPIHRVTGGVDVLGEARARPPVSAKRFEGRRRDRVDGIGPDQLFDVDDVAIGGFFTPVLAHSRRCVWAPRAASASQRRRGRAPGSAGRRAWRWRWPPCRSAHAGEPASRMRRCLQACRDQRIDGGVDPADEEAGHAGQRRVGSPPRATSFSSPAM